MKLLEVAIIGAGNIAGGYDSKKILNDGGVYSHAGAYKAHGAFSLRSVYDVDEAASKKFQKEWGITQALFGEESFCQTYHDIVSICTPDATHFAYAERLIKSNCCKTLFIEKPLSNDAKKVEYIAKLARISGINVVINFQRRHEEVHKKLLEEISACIDSVLSVSAYYTKGLCHIGVTLIDTLRFFFGNPSSVQAFNRVYNYEINDYSYEFMMFYTYFSVVIKTSDVERDFYNYHLFELDILFRKKRIVIHDNSQRIKTVPITSYAYSGVNVLNERIAQYADTSYKYSMLNSIAYIYDVTVGNICHTINTPDSSFNNLLIINAVVESFNQGGKRVFLENGIWKK